MSLLFNRKTELHVFTTGEKTIIKGLDMSFNIVATRDSKPNTAKITVFNLAETSRNLFSTSMLGIEFWAGYGENIGMIFRGSWDDETSKIRHKKNGTTWVTTIETGDGLKEFQNTFFDKSYSKGIDVKTILTDVANSMGLPVVLDYDGNDILNSGASYSGKANSVLDDLAIEYNLGWSIQHGAVEIVDPDDPPKNDATAVLLTPDTGLVGRPTITDKGMECGALMMATIKPTRLVKLDPATIDTDLGSKQDAIKSGIKPTASGVYIVDRVQYTGDNMGGPFNTKITSELAVEK